MGSFWKTLSRPFRGQPVQSEVPLSADRMPAHIAIIMDGNGRWAKRRLLPRAAGHHAGMVAMRETIRACDDLGIRVLTLYAFSTENWTRPVTEVQYLWHLVGEFFRSDMDELVERNVRITFIGDTTALPDETQLFVRRAIELTAGNSGLVVQFALNYGGRWEIVRAVRKIAQSVKDDSLDVQEIDETVVSAALETSGLPDPDLLIRTSGDQRISNFLLWQVAYAELYFVPHMWPAFRREDLMAAIREYANRDRRFGGLK